MKCNNCGTELAENDMFCPNCGTQIQRIGGNIQNSNEEMYNYDRPVNQQINNNVQSAPIPNQQNYEQQYENNGKNNNTVKICIIVAIVVTLIAAWVLIGYLIFRTINNKKSKTNEAVASTTSTISSTTSTTTSTSSATSDTQNKSSTYKVNCGGFNLYIPNNLIYEIVASDELSLYPADESCYLKLGIEDGNFSKMKLNKNNLITYWGSLWGDEFKAVTNPTLETVDGIEFITVDVTIMGQNCVITYAPINSMYVLWALLLNENDSFDKSALKNLAAIVKTAEYTGDSKNLELEENIKITDIKEALTKITEENTSDNN